jgi:hypothetical protein|tara:strand:- start:91 stop:681 length:591 start_codon:yes stop_codon:yes gene_type:complete
MTVQDQYFVVKSTSDSPMFGWNQPSGDYGMGYPLMSTEPVKLKVSENAGPEPNWRDFHALDGAAISDRLKRVLEPLDLYGVEYVPADVETPSAPSVQAPTYWFWHVWNEITCVDRAHSVLELSPRGRIISIDKLVLDEPLLGRFERRKTLIFRLREKPSTLIVHRLLKEAIEQAGATGMRFFPAREWSSNAIFVER